MADLRWLWRWLLTGEWLGRWLAFLLFLLFLLCVYFFLLCSPMFLFSPSVSHGAVVDWENSGSWRWWWWQSDGGSSLRWRAVFCCSFFLLLPRAEAPTSVFLPSLLLFALLYCFCHLASLLLLPNGGSNMKVGSALLFWLLRWRCCGGGRWRCRGSWTAAPSSSETRLFTPLGISFYFLFSSLSSLFPFYTPCLHSLKFPPLFQASLYSFLPFSLFSLFSFKLLSLT